MAIVEIQKPKSIILDIEGTTTPIDFVHKTLFGYIREKLKQGWLKEHWQHEDVAECMHLMNFKESCHDIPYEDQALKHIEDMMDRDVKCLGLKKLQAIIMLEGYTDGSIKSVIFKDVLTKIKLWREIGLKIYIYSSGSVNAQKLLFRYTQFGDLTSYIDGYFDTNVGPKILSSSYDNILSQINCASNEALFLSDNIQEIIAATKAGLMSIFVIRPGNAPTNETYVDGVLKIHTFEDIVFS